MSQTPDVSGGNTPPEPTIDSHAAPGLERRHLLVFSGSSSWLYQLPQSGKVIIGRSENADLRIDNGSVSRQHACLAIEGDGITVEDLGSQNGTYVNDAKVSGEQAVHAN